MCSFEKNKSCVTNAAFVLPGCNLTPGRAADRSGFQTWLGSRLLPYLTQLQAATNGRTQKVGRHTERSYSVSEPGNAALRHTWDQFGLWSLLHRHRQTELTSVVHNPPTLIELYILSDFSIKRQHVERWI